MANKHVGLHIMIVYYATRAA